MSSQVQMELQVRPGVYQRVMVDAASVDLFRESGWSLAQGIGPVISQLLPYFKPLTGIPIGDLEAAAQTALANAATAVSSSALTAAMAQVKSDIQAGVGVSLDTLAELAAALNNDPNFATTIATLMAGKAALLDVASAVTVAGALVVAKVNPVDATVGTVAMTLPTPATKGLMTSVEKADSSANTVTVTGTIRGANTTLTLSLYRESILFVSDAAGSWRPLSDHKTLSSLDGRFLKQADAATTYAAISAALMDAAAAPDLMAVGTITRSVNGAATGFSVVWAVDGATGTFAGTESTTAPGAIDSYTVTHVLGGVTKTYTQPALTRNASGAVTARPAMTVS